jgi:hypothetical protein
MKRAAVPPCERTGIAAKRHRLRRRKVMSILMTLNRIATRYAEVRTRYLTDLHVRALPLEIQKDIGWPGSQDRVSRRPDPVSVRTEH